VLVVLYAVLTMAPLAWIFVTGFKSGPDSIAYPAKVVFTPSTEGYCNLFKTRSRQTPEYIAQLPPVAGVCDAHGTRQQHWSWWARPITRRVSSTAYHRFGSTALSVVSA